MHTTVRELVTSDVLQIAPLSRNSMVHFVVGIYCQYDIIIVT